MGLQRIVVGVDGSRGAADALRWAAAEAAIHGTRAKAVLAWTYLVQYHEDPEDISFRNSYDAASAGESLDGYVRAALGEESAVDRQVVCDVASSALLDESEHADLLVIGARGGGGFEDLLLGSVAGRVVERADCPVAVVRGTSTPGGPIVVGIDGSARANSALRWAADEARARDVALDVVHAWRFPVLAPGGWMPSIPTHDEARTAASDLVADALAAVAVDDLRVTTHVAEAGAAKCLLERATGAGLLVVGTRGAGRLSGWLLGSVSRQLVEHASCPVVVV